MDETKDFKQDIPVAPVAKVVEHSYGYDKPKQHKPSKEEIASIDSELAAGLKGLASRAEALGRGDLAEKLRGLV